MRWLAMLQSDFDTDNKESTLPIIVLVGIAKIFILVLKAIILRKVLVIQTKRRRLSGYRSSSISHSVDFSYGRG